GRWRAHVEIGYRLRPADDARAGIHAGQEVARPDLAAAIRHLWREYDVTRQVLILGAEPVSHPASNARSLEGHAARMDAERRLEVIVVIAAHGADDAEIVGALGDVGEEVGNFGAGFPARLGGPRRAERLAVVVEGLAVALVFAELGLRVERIDVRHAAAQIDEDDALGRAREVRGFGRERRGFSGEQVVQDGREQPRSQQEGSHHLAAIEVAGHENAPWHQVYLFFSCGADFQSAMPRFVGAFLVFDARRKNAPTNRGIAGPRYF